MTAPLKAARASKDQQTFGATLKTFANDFVADDVLSLAAALSFYTTLALSPLLVLALTFAGSLYPAAQERLIGEIGQVVGPQVEPFLRQIIESSAEQPDLRQAAGWGSLVILIIGASGVFAQLQASLNRVWDAENQKLAGVWGFLRRRFLSAGVLLALLFVTILSLGVQAALSSVPYFDEGVLVVVGWLLSVLVYAVLFTGLYRWLPDRRVPWWTAFRGGLLTAFLFMVGRALIGLYLAQTDTAGAFGPAGGVVLWLLWAYYSALIFLGSAELLYAVSAARGWRWIADPTPPDAAPARPAQARSHDTRPFPEATVAARPGVDLVKHEPGLVGALATARARLRLPEGAVRQRNPAALASVVAGAIGLAGWIVRGVRAGRLVR